MFVRRRHQCARASMTKKKEANGPETFVCAARPSIRKKQKLYKCVKRESIRAASGQVFFSSASASMFHQSQSSDVAAEICQALFRAPPLGQTTYTLWPKVCGHPHPFMVWWRRLPISAWQYPKSAPIRRTEYVICPWQAGDFWPDALNSRLTLKTVANHCFFDVKMVKVRFGPTNDGAGNRLPVEGHFSFHTVPQGPWLLLSF